MAKISKNVLIPVIGLLVFAAVAALAYFYLPSKYRPLTADEAAKKAIEYVNANMLMPGVEATYKDVKMEDGLYTFKLNVQGQDYDAYVTKSGKLFFPQVINLNETIKTEDEKAAELPKSDKPDVKIFVMSYCPFGLQMQKAYLPVYNLLKDKTNMGVYFVNYAMHGKKELEENLRQYCIQKEQTGKYAAYLDCFVTSKSDEEGNVNYNSCLVKAGVDGSKLASCVTATDNEFKVLTNYEDKSTWLSGKYPKFEVESALNTQYNVAGSPTVIINDTDASAAITSRSPEGLKQVICSTFNQQPEECGTSLSQDTPIAGFGAGTESATDANANGADGGCSE